MAKKSVENKENKIEEVKTEEAKTEMPKRKRVKIERDLEVKVMNLCPCTFYHFDDKTQTPYTFRNYGDFDYMTIDELMRMRNKTPKVFNEFWIMIADVEDDEIELEDVLTYLQLDKLYAETTSIEKIDNMLIEDSFEVFENMIKNMSDMLFNKVTERAVELFREKKFSDTWKMNTIEKKLNKDHLFSDITKTMN